MKDGVIRQVASPEEIYGRPADMFVAGFISNPQMNFFKGLVGINGAKAVITAGGFSVEVPKNIVGDRDEVVFAVRPEDFDLNPEGTAYIVIE